MKRHDRDFHEQPADRRPPTADRRPPTADRRPRAVLALVGVVLLTAAVLKLYGWNVSPFAQYGWLLTPSVQTVAWELFLGLWLLGGSRRRVVWLLALLTFGAFAVVSGYLGLIGQAKCGCFGVIEASPWVAFGVDAVVLALLASSRPHGESESSVRWIGAVGVVLALGLTTSLILFGSAEAAVAKLRGHTLMTSPYLDFGRGNTGEIKQTTATVQNWTATPLRLVGGTSDCSCLATEDLPITIPPGGRAEVRVTLKIPAGTPGQLSRLVEFLTDCPKHPRLRFTASVLVE